MPMSFSTFFSLKHIINEISVHNAQKSSPEELKKCQKALLDIYRNLMQVCDKYDIKPILVGGTMLGKFRHDGFIPWDDDMDLAMTRKDYEKLKKVFAKEMPRQFIMEVPNFGAESKYRFMKIRRKNAYCKMAKVF